MSSNVKLCLPDCQLSSFPNDRVHAWSCNKCKHPNNPHLWEEFQRICSFLPVKSTAITDYSHILHQLASTMKTYNIVYETIYLSSPLAGQVPAMSFGSKVALHVLLVFLQQLQLLDQFAGLLQY